MNVYSYKNNFDYTRWVEKSKVTLTNVLWNSDYDDVVNFDTNESRDKWFDDKDDGFEIVLTANHTLPPEGGIKLPIPFDIASRYNYLFVDIPVMTSVDVPIEYEDAEFGIRRWYFFIDTVSSRAPNTTMFNLSLDVWTQFQNDLEIKYMYLERGHAPVAATDVDTYLSNPIGNNEYLLTPDVTPTAANVVRSATYVPFGDGEKWFCIATAMNRDQLRDIGAVTTSSDYTFGTITYSNSVARNGYQEIVNNYGVGNGKNFSSLKLNAVANACDSAKHRIQNNVHVFALPASEVHDTGWHAGSFFYDVKESCPNLMNAILGVFIVDREMIDLVHDEPISIAGHDVYSVSGSDRTDSIPTLQKSDFSFPEEYQRFAKLYTHPYSTIELTDNEGEVVEVRIENTGTIDVHRVTQLAFPFVNMRTFFTGINGVGSTRYKWKLLNGNESTAEIWNGDWFECCFDHDIPCYALYMDGETAWYVDNFNSSIKGARQSALVSYHGTVRSANTAKENTDDSNDTMYANADADASTLVTNTANTTSTNTANANATIANNSLKTTHSNNIATLITDLGNAKISDLNSTANYASSTTTVADNEVTAATARANGLGGVIGAAGNAIVGGAMFGALSGGTVGSVVPGAGTLAGVAGGAAIGGIMGLISAGASWGAADAGASAVIQGNIVAVNANNNANNYSTGYTQQHNSSVTYDLNDERTYNTNHDNELLSGNTTRSNNNLTTNNGNTASTMRANADRTRGTGNANGNYTRGTIVQNAKEVLENSRRSPQYQMYDARNASPRTYGSYAGNPTPDYMRTRGVQMKVRTMPDAEVRQVGDWFARYGYALEQNWNLEESGLCPMRHFCYWKTRDIWVDDMKSSNNAAITLITAMFKRGVTVWNNPDEVGRVSIYDN